MILVDTSAWIEFLRASGGPAHRTVRRLLVAGADVVATEPIVMELLAGARTGRELELVRSRLVGLPLLSVEGLADYEEAASIFRTCRAEGETIRSLVDCLIAVPAIRAGAAILHVDRDFDVISRHTALAIEALDEG